MSEEQFVKAYNKASNTAALKTGRDAGNRLADRSQYQRKGIQGKPDASSFPSYAYKWKQLDPGDEDYEQNLVEAQWDKHFTATRSSNIKWIFYATYHQKLKAEFLDGSRYMYFNVPVQVYNRLEYTERSGGSVGSEFWKLMRIKPLAHRYNYRKLTGDSHGSYGNRPIIGRFARYGMPDVNDTPNYAAHTRRAMYQAEYARNKRAEARSSRTRAGTGGQSARAKKIAGGRR